MFFETCEKKKTSVCLRISHKVRILSAQSSKVNKHFINSVTLNEDTWAKMSIFLARWANIINNSVQLRVLLSSILFNILPTPLPKQHAHPRSHPLEGGEEQPATFHPNSIKLIRLNHQGEATQHPPPLHLQKHTVHT